MALFWALKWLRGKGTPLLMPLVMDLARLKTIRYVVPRHINNRYIKVIIFPIPDGGKETK
jgi:hypothetical protein